MATDTTHDQRSTGQLVSDLSEQTARLVRHELELARAEMTQKGKRAGLGVGLFGGAGMFVFYALGALTAAGILLLARAMTTWLAALVVAVVLVLVAGAAALVGRVQIARSVPPLPEQAIETSREDVELIRERTHGIRA
jgi:hypothetical protein